MGPTEVGSGCTPEHLSVVVGFFGWLPPDYVSYLGEYGWFCLSFHEVMGFGLGVPKQLNVIEIARWERELAYPPMPTNLLPLENNGAGDHYCIDLANPSNPVVFWSHEDGQDQVPAIVAPSFVTWACDLFDEVDG